MRSRIVMMTVLLAAMTVWGCAPMAMDAEYGELLDTETYRSAAIAGLALNGRLELAEMRMELMRAACVLRYFKDAKDGLRPADYIDKPQ